MKKIIQIFLFALIPFLGMSQKYKDPTLEGIRENRFRNDSVLQIPIGLTGSNNGLRTKLTYPALPHGYDTAQLRYEPSDSSLRIWTGWQFLKIGSDGGGGGSNTDSLFGLQDNLATGNRSFDPGTFNLDIDPVGGTIYRFKKESLNLTAGNFTNNNYAFVLEDIASNLPSMSIGIHDSTGGDSHIQFDGVGDSNGFISEADHGANHSDFELRPIGIFVNPNAGELWLENLNRMTTANSLLGQDSVGGLSGYIKVSYGLSLANGFLNADTSSGGLATQYDLTQVGGSSQTLQQTFNTQVGGSVLTKIDTISNGAFQLKILGSNTSGGNLFVRNNTGGYAIEAYNSGSFGMAFNATADNTGGIAYYALTSGGSYLFDGTMDAASTNDVKTARFETRRSSGGAGSNGIGIANEWYLENSSSGTTSAGKLAIVATDASVGTFTTQIDLYGKLNAGLYKRHMNIQGDGIVRVNNDADTLATRAYARSVGGGGGGGGSQTLQQVINVEGVAQLTKGDTIYANNHPLLFDNVSGFNINAVGTYHLKIGTGTIYHDANNNTTQFGYLSGTDFADVFITGNSGSGNKQAYLEAGAGSAWSYFYASDTALTLKAQGGRISIPSMESSNNAPDSMVVWNSLNKRIGYRPIPSGGGGSTALSAITAAVAANTIANSNDPQIWQWNSLTGKTAFTVSSTSTAASGNAQILASILLSGTNATASQTTTALSVSNTHGGTGSTNYSIYSSATTGDLENYGLYSEATGNGNIAGYFNAFSGSTNYAIIVPNGGGNVGIGTSTPSSYAAIELGQTDQGFLVNRLTSTQQSTFISPPAGLMIFNTDSARLMLRSGGIWKGIMFTNEDVSGGGGGVSDGDKGDITVSSSGTVWTFDYKRNMIYTTATGTDANITAVAGTSYNLPAATLTTNKTIDMTNVNTNGDYVEFYNNETGFIWSFTGQTVYDSDGSTVVTELLANGNSVVRRINGKLMISRL